MGELRLIEPMRWLYQSPLGGFFASDSGFEPETAA
jgi:hypothetical protein